MSPDDPLTVLIEYLALSPRPRLNADSFDCVTLNGVNVCSAWE